MARVFKGDVGTLIRIAMGENIAAATGEEMRVKKPNGTLVTWTPTLNGTNLDYTVVEDDLDEAGAYRINPHMTIGSWVGYFNTVGFVVYEPYT